MLSVDSLLREIKSHRVFDHPLYAHWSAAPPPAEASRALFRQIQEFCESTRPDGALIEDIRKLGWNDQVGLMEELADSGELRFRDLSRRESTIRYLGVALALEIVWNESLIPREMRILADGGNCSAAATDKTEMHCPAERQSACGVELLHVENIIKVVGSVLNDHNFGCIAAGVHDFLESLAGLWDDLDAALLTLGVR